MPTYLIEKPQQKIPQAFIKYKEAFNLLSLSRVYNPHCQPLQVSEIKAFLDVRDIKCVEERNFYLNIILRLDSFYLSEIRKKYEK